MEGCIAPRSPGNRSSGCTGRVSKQEGLQDISGQRVKNGAIVTQFFGASSRQHLQPWIGLQPLGTAG